MVGIKIRKIIAILIVIVFLGFFLAYMFSFYGESKNLVDSNKDSKNLNLLTIHAKNNDVTINVEYATTAVELAQGLMFRNSLNASSGMLFVFDDESIRTFWMKNTLIPLDMIFISSNLTIVDIVKNAQPCAQDPCQLYESKLPARYVLEVNGGFSEFQNIGEGNTVTVDLPINRLNGD
jgi:uncharacterized protein